MKKSVQKKPIRFRIKTQTPSHYSSYNLDQEINKNRKMLNLMRQQYQGMKRKLHISDSSITKIQLDNEIENTKEKIKEIKFFINEGKRKNILGEKRIKNNQGHKVISNKNFYDLQQQYINLLKKKEKLEKKNSQVEEENANLIYEDDDVTESYNTVKHKYTETLPTEEQKIHEHQKVLYDTKKKKMQLMVKKRERDEDYFRKKYYGLLLDYDKILNRGSQNEEKQKRMDIQLEKMSSLLQNLKRQLANKSTNEPTVKIVHKLQHINRHKKHKTQLGNQDEYEEENYQGFLLTEFNNTHKRQISQFSMNQTPVNKIAYTSASEHQIKISSKKNSFPENNEEKKLPLQNKLGKLDLSVRESGSIESQINYSENEKT